MQQTKFYVKNLIISLIFHISPKPVPASMKGDDLSVTKKKANKLRDKLRKKDVDRILMF